MFFLFAMFVGFVGYKLASSPDKELPPFKLGVGAVQVNPYRVERPTDYVNILTRLLTAGGVPSDQLLDAAFTQAQTKRDYPIMQIIAQLVQRRAYEQAMAQQYQNALQEQSAPPPTVSGGEEDLSEYESANPEPSAELMQSPISDIPTEDWCNLVKSLKTRTPDYSDGNRRGAWEHHRGRLKQLGLDEASLASEAGQYRALCEDLSDYHTKCRALFDKYCGDSVDINGVRHPVTMSGMLGLLKAAGPKGAEGWLTNPSDRKSFPQTTATFVRTNGLF